MHTHIHKYQFESKDANFHKHKILGYTEHTIGINTLHIHTFYGISSYRGHTHCFSGFTGFPIRTENGHIHKMEGYLEPSKMHQHIFCNYTDEEISYINSKKSARIYI